ncbi:MAG: hypothetical protein N4A63_02260 [Vallitalea sp.]|jgi:hypothetical protein|nr:hypothetical protein [Vallitalea sp.]
MDKPVKACSNCVNNIPRKKREKKQYKVINHYPDISEEERKRRERHSIEVMFNIHQRYINNTQQNKTR